jgi:hypothetical protein
MANANPVSMSARDAQHRLHAPPPEVIARCFSHWR